MAKAQLDVAINAPDVIKTIDGIIKGLQDTERATKATRLAAAEYAAAYEIAEARTMELAEADKLLADVMNGEVLLAQRASAMAVRELAAAEAAAKAGIDRFLESAGFITKARFDEDVTELAAAFRELRTQGVTSGSVYDSLTQKWNALGVQAKASGIDIRASMGGVNDGLRPIPDKVSAIGKAWEGTGPVVRRSADAIVDGLKSATGATEMLAKAGPLATSGAVIAFKAMEESIEGVINGLVRGQEAGKGLAGQISALGGTVATGTTALLAGAAAAAGFAVALYKLQDAAIELKNTNIDAADAQSRANDPTARQIEQMKQLAAALKMPLAELMKFKYGEGAEGFAAILENVNRNPAGQMAIEFNKLGAAAREAVKENRGLADSLGPLKDRFASLNIEKVTNEGKALEIMLRDLTKTTGMESSAVKLLESDFQKFEERAKLTGAAVPPEVQRILDKLREVKDVSAAAVEDADGAIQYAWVQERVDNIKKMLADENKAYDEAYEARLAATRALNTKLAAESGALSAKIQADFQKSVDAINATKSTMDISGGEDARRVNVDKSDPAIQRLLTRLIAKDPMKQDQYLLEASKAIKAGNITALENLVKASADQAVALSRIHGAQGAGLAAKGVSQTLAQVLRALLEITGGEKRAAGGPVKAGEWYIVNEGRPGPWQAPANGTIVPQAPPGGGMTGGSDRAIAALAGQVATLTATVGTMARRPISVQINGREIAAATNEANSRGNNSRI